MRKPASSLMRRVLAFLQDTPPDSVQLKQATNDLLEEIHRARDACAQMVASAARARLQYQQALKQREDLMARAVQEHDRGESGQVRQTAERLLALDRRLEGLEAAWRERDHQAQSAQAAYQDLERESTRRLKEAREIEHLEALNRLRAAMLESIACFQQTRAQAEFDELAERLRAEAVKGDMAAELAGGERARLEQTLREQTGEQRIEDLVEEVRWRAETARHIG